MGTAGNRTFRIGTRQSPLATAQAAEVIDALEAAGSTLTPQMVTVSTQGDRMKDAPLSTLERGIFASEINRALLQGEIDAAVHSAKDVPASAGEGLVIAAICRRRDPRDVLIDRWDAGLVDLPQGASVGTGSPRRTAQLLSVRPDLEVVPIRGNVGTRIGRVSEGICDAVVVAAAGIQRLRLSLRSADHLDSQVFTPEVGQGALIVQVREGDERAAKIISLADHGPTRAAVSAERAFLLAIGGGCTAPVAAHARIRDGRLRMHAMAATPDGTSMFRHEAEGDASSPEQCGQDLAAGLIARGAAAILADS